MAMSPPNLLKGNSLGRVPKRMTTVTLESVLSTNRGDCQEKFRRDLNRIQGRDVEERKMLLEATDVTLQVPGQSVPRRKYEVAW